MWMGGFICGGCRNWEVGHVEIYAVDLLDGVALLFRGGVWRQDQSREGDAEGNQPPPVRDERSCSIAPGGCPGTWGNHPGVAVGGPVRELLGRDLSRAAWHVGESGCAFA